MTGTLRACIAAAMLVATTAGTASAGFTALDEKCAMKLGVEASDLHHLETFRAVLSKFAELSGDDTGAPVTEKEARALLCPNDSCTSWKPFEWRDGVWIHLVIPDAIGGAYVVTEIGWIGGSSACSLGEPTKIEQLGAGIYLITIHEKAGNYGGGDDPDSYCSNQEFATSRLLLDLHTGRWLVMAIADDDAEITIKAGYVKARACKTLKLDEGITALRARKPQTLVVSPALPLINEARRLTKAKKYGDAIKRFDQAVARDAEAARAWSGRGYAKLLAGQHAEARKDLEKALELDPDKRFQAAVWFNLGTVAEALKDRKAARAAYAKSQKLRPSKAAAKRLKALGAK